MWGDRNELADLFQRYGALVYRRARRLLGDTHAAEDACQEVFLRLWRARPSFTETSPVTWLYRVTTNHCLNLMRDGRRRRALAAARTPPPPHQPDHEVARLLEGIPEPLQAVGVYYYLDEMTQDEIALVLGVSQRTVSNRLKEFRSLLRADDERDAECEEA
jgi:RNA polymerase sigma-70 factor, ECF subfamily